MEVLEIINKVDLLYGSWGYILIFLSSLIETTPLGWAIPGGTIVILGGFFAYGNSLSLIGVIISGWMGMFITFLGGYYLGKTTGVKIAKKFNQENNAKKAAALFKNNGPLVLTTSLLANLTRFWISFFAGKERYNFIGFTFYAAVASLTWNSLLATIGYIIGSKRSNLETGIAKFGIISWMFLFLALIIIFYVLKKELSKNITDDNFKK